MLKGLRRGSPLLARQPTCRPSQRGLFLLWLLTHLIDDKDRCAAHRRGPVGGFPVADLKSRTRWRFNATIIGEAGHKSTLEDEYDMPPRAPVIGAVIRRELRQARARSVTVPVSPPEIVGGSSDHRMTAKGVSLMRVRSICLSLFRPGRSTWLGTVEPEFYLRGVLLESRRMFSLRRDVVPLTCTVTAFFAVQREDQLALSDDAHV